MFKYHEDGGGNGGIVGSISKSLLDICCGFKHQSDILCGENMSFKSGFSIIV